MELMDMLNNHYIWGLMGIDSQGILSIFQIPTVVSKRSGDTVARDFCGTSLATNLEVYISADSLLDTVTTENPVQIDSPNYVLPPPNINKHDKSVK